MLRHCLRLARPSRVFSQQKAARLFSVYTNKDDEANGINALDRLLLIKPAISEEPDEYDYEGLPEDDMVELDGEPDPRLRLSKKLLAMGRVYYRHVEDVPEWFTAKKAEICNNRTTAQIRRCLKDWMFDFDRTTNNRFAAKPLMFGETMAQGKNGKAPRTTTAFGPEETAAYANYFMPSRYSITKRVFTELKTLVPTFKPKRIVDFGCGPGTAAAAAYTVWGSEGTEKYTGIDMSQSMVDAAKIMTRDLIPDCVFWDKSGDVIKRAVARHERFDMAVLSYTLSDFANDPTRRAAVQIMFELLDVGGYLVIVDSGNPKGSNMARSARQLVLDIFNHSDAAGKAPYRMSSNYVTPESDDRDDDDEHDNDDSGDDHGDVDKQIKKHKKKGKKPFHPQCGRGATDTIIEGKFSTLILPAPPGYTHDELGAYVVAPCTHDKRCPLAPGTWCSFSQKVHSGLIHKANEEKFSYVVIQKRPKPAASVVKSTATPAQQRVAAGKKGSVVLPAPEVGKRDPASFGHWTEQAATDTRGPVADDTDAPAAQVDPTPLNVLRRFVDLPPEDTQEVIDKLLDEVDWDEYNPPLYREDYGRLIRSPIKNKGHVVMDICQPGGDIQRTTLSKKNLVAVPALYTAMRKTTWGGLFPVLADDNQHSPLAVRAKGNRGKVGEPRGRFDVMVSDADMGEHDEDEDDPFMQVAKKKQQVLLRGKAGGNKRGSKHAMPSPEELRALAMQAKKNHFTGRPTHSKTYYPPIEPHDGDDQSRPAVRAPKQLIKGGKYVNKNFNRSAGEQTVEFSGSSGSGSGSVKKSTGVANNSGSSGGGGRKKVEHIVSEQVRKLSEQRRARREAAAAAAKAGGDDSA